MKNEVLYNRTVDILVQAYFDDTLRHGDYCSCAVGNLVARNRGLKMIPQAERPEEFFWLNSSGVKSYGSPWYSFIQDIREGRSPSDAPEGRKQISDTGYSVDEICMIEAAFEKTRLQPAECSSFNGLMSVIDVLDRIHENTDTATTQSTKARFVRA